MGGDGGLQVEAADTTTYNTRRTFLQRVAGNHNKVALAWRDDTSLRLPASLACFPERSLNRDLYLWLTALAAVDESVETDWFIHSQRMTSKALSRFPGLQPRYQRLLEAHLQQRPIPEELPDEEARVEQALRQALSQPGSIEQLSVSRYAPYPVHLWLHPDPPRPITLPSSDDDEENNDDHSGEFRDASEIGRRQAERVESPEENRGLVTIRMENIFSWGEFIKLDRDTDDEEDLDTAEAVAKDLDVISVTRNQKAAKARLKFDLDLPSEQADDNILDSGILLPEWDWKKQRLLPDRCRIVSMMADDAAPLDLPDHLKRMAKRLQNQFQAVAPARKWHRSQADGQEVDLDAYLQYATDRRAGHSMGADKLYKELRSGNRDLACLLLADLSLSTDTWVDDHHRVIDIIRDSLFLFAECLHATGDRFGMYGFSSRKRDPVRVHTLKTFDEKYTAGIRGRINAIKPGYYTRLGAGIRHASNLLKVQPAGHRLLLILTDGKPNDLDQYEGRYGIEDTRQAVNEARQLGLQPFCVTIDEKANDYLPHLFGTNGYALIRRAADLPKSLPLLYAKLTA
jgi:nitric oxide reductase NorD protein